MSGIITGILLTLYGLFILIFNVQVTQDTFLFFGIGWFIAASILAVIRRFA